MKPTNRRSFIPNSAVRGATVAVGAQLRPSAWAAPAGANAAIRVGIIGLGNQGLQHLKLLLKRTDVRVVGLCDVDPRFLASRKLPLSGSADNVSGPKTPLWRAMKMVTFRRDRERKIKAARLSV